MEARISKNTPIQIRNTIVTWDMVVANITDDLIKV